MPMFSVRAVGIVLAGCLMASVSARGATEAVVYTFGAANHGQNPSAGLIDVNGRLYGTTGAGGKHTNCSGGCGTVFWVTPEGIEKVVYSFNGAGNLEDGSYPSAGLLKVSGKYYGTTQDCGANNLGTVFAVEKSGAETFVYSFRGGSDGANPKAGLIEVGGSLYGTTVTGGNVTPFNNSGGGTVFSITTAGNEKVVYAFNGAGNPDDGASPNAGLINVGGTLYGTTELGGVASANCPSGCGTVFSITPAGTETVVYSFKGGSDGAFPRAALINVGGTLYGTTSTGGGTGCTGPGCGAVFSVTPEGSEKVVYAFGGPPSDGYYPNAGLINLGGLLYGTTSAGGAIDAGTVFSLTKAGKEKVLHSFVGGSDGEDPLSSLTDVGGVLYGTTYEGGACNCGTVFSVTP